ncbi:MAG: 6-hydroxycyclohex-1-ene-1-carbonyl-CoA dehydrogenase [Deltaproteobacteria bacterium]|nr:6-hydroxycyclohex-1-ene-1-carbonyl-CoA dehydrogenase [Deltaproteobacteria bacterium]
MTAFTGFALYEQGALPRPIRRSPPPLDDDQVLVRVAGCGICHTDLGFIYRGIRTRHALPLILGHEISGVVEEAGAGFAHLAGTPVVVPAVLPCNQCDDCRAGQTMICTQQIMPGNDADGGFATHVVLPGAGLCPIPGGSADPDASLGDVPGLTLRHMAVVADAVATAYQAVERSGLGPGELVVVMGLGGAGGFAAQIAADRGAVVVGLDVDPDRLAAGDQFGCRNTLSPLGRHPREIRALVRDVAKEFGAPLTRWTIIECSGTAAGQQTAFGLLVPGATLMLVGYTLEKVELRLSNLMAFDARALGNWGCDPALYPAIVDLVLQGRIALVPHSEIRPLNEIGSALEDVHHGRAQRRIVLAP